MTKSTWLHCALLGTAAVSGAAAGENVQAPIAAEPGTGASAASDGQDQIPPNSSQPSEQDDGDIIVTATRRASPLSDVPIAVTAVTGEALRNSGASDIRQLNQLSPSLLVSSTSSEAGAGGAGIRGIRTVGDNAGLESSVATFIDGVYRNRAGIGLTELGPVDRIEVLRGPQGTLFGRNASAGLINIVTARPQRDHEIYAEATIGNFNSRRLAGGVTGPLGSLHAFRIDGVYSKRDGFLKDVISGRSVNNRDRFLIRGKLLLEPSPDLSILLIGDYTKRDEECCAAPYLPARDVTRNPDGSINVLPSSIAALERSLFSAVPGAGYGLILDDPFDRKVAITPGRSFRSDVTDGGLSGEVTYKLGGARLTSITAYRGFKYIKGQDADYNNLDIFARPGDGQGFTRFKTFTQEVRAQGTALSDRLDWLVGGYFADERLTFIDNIRYGVDFDAFASGRVGLLSPQLSAFPLFGFKNLNGFARAFVNAQLPAGLPSAVRDALINSVANNVQNVILNDTGRLDHYEQTSRNMALFTHNQFKVADSLTLTLGVRYTRERKELDARFESNGGCTTYVENIHRLRGFAATPGTNPTSAALAGALANSVLAPLAGLPCAINGVNGELHDSKKEGEWTGTAVVSYKPTPRLLTYASFSRGYKAGGYNLDYAPLFNPITLVSGANPDAFSFEPETVTAFEVGAKLNLRRFDLNVAAFYQAFRNFQLNTFNGTTFFVTNIQGCKDDLGDSDEDLVAGNSSCAHTRSGVVSKGLEIEASYRPIADVATTLGVTLADTRYRKDLAGTPDLVTGDNSLQPALFLLPGHRLSNSAAYVVTGSAGWTPPIGSSLRGLAYADIRYTSKMNTGSDLFSEKSQPGVATVNARLGIGADNRRWSIEIFAQNLFDADYRQVSFNSPVQGSNTSVDQTEAFGTRGTQLFSAYLAEPRTFGLTARAGF